MLPVIAYNLLQSVEILANASQHLVPVIESFAVNEDAMAQNLALNPILATALNPLIGYRKAAEVAKAAVQKNRPILEVALEMTEIDEDNLRALLDPENLVRNKPGKPE
jgi:fumarate hydratase class II